MPGDGSEISDVLKELRELRTLVEANKYAIDIANAPSSYSWATIQKVEKALLEKPKDWPMTFDQIEEIIWPGATLRPLFPRYIVYQIVHRLRVRHGRGAIINIRGKGYMWNPLAPKPEE